MSSRTTSFGAALALALSIAVLVFVVAPSQAQNGELTLVAITSNADYDEITLTFSQPVFRLDGDGNAMTGDDDDDPPPLEPDDFALSDGSVSIDVVSSQGSDRTTWTLELSTDVLPHALTISAEDGAIGNADGHALVFTAAVPLSSDHIANLVDAIRGLELPIDPGAIVLPFLQDWLEEGRNLAELIPDLADLDVPTTEAELIEALEEIAGIDGIDINGFNVGLSFDETFATSHTIAASAGVDRTVDEVFDISVDASLEVEISLGGGVVINVDGGGVSVDASNLPSANFSADGQFNGSGRLGIVDMSAQAQAQVAASIALTDLSGSAFDISGTASLAVTKVAIEGTGLEFDGTIDDALLAIEWPDLDDLFSCEFGSLVHDQELGAFYCEEPATAGACPDGSSPIDAEGVETCFFDPIENVTVDSSLFDSLDLRNFTRISVDSFTTGLAWFAGWLTEVQQFEHLGAELPIIGGTTGGLTQLADGIAGPVVALNDLIGLIRTVSEEADISAQHLSGICNMDASEVDALVDEYAALLGITDTDEIGDLKEHFQLAVARCAGVLENVNIIGTDAIEFTVQVEATVDLFNNNGNGSPTINFNIVDDLDGISLGATSGSWTATASTSFDLTVGIKIASDGELGIEPEDPNLGSRFYIKVPDDDSDIASAALDIQGQGLGFSARLGFLDLAASGSVTVDPSFTIGLDTAQGELTLVDLAQAADAENLGSLIELRMDAVADAIDASFTLNNSVLDLGASLDISGPASALTDPSTFNISHDLGDALELRNITPFQAIRMITDLAERIAAMAAVEAMDLSVPFVDVRFQEAVDFARDFLDVAESVAERDPQHISALESALRDALAEAGLPSDVDVGLTGQELTLGFDVEKTVEKTYPFSLEGGGLNIAPADGGASISATAGVSFSPTVGISFDDGLPMNQRLFLRGTRLDFTMWVDANAFGTVYLGPLSAGIEGNVQVGSEDEPATLSVGIGSPGQTITLANLTTGLASLLAPEYQGAITGNLTLTATGIGTGTVTVTGDLAEPGAIEVEHEFDLDLLSLDLETLIFGTFEFSRFVGRMLEQSELLTTSLPLIGDELRALATIGTDLRTAAQDLHTQWENAANDDDFVEEIAVILSDVLCPAAPPGDLCVSVELDGDTLATAQGIEVRLELEGTFSTDLDIAGGLDFSPVFSLSADFDSDAIAGYSMDVVLGLSITDGFYVEAGGSQDDDVLQLFAGVELSGNADATILGIGAEITGASGGISGSLGPSDPTHQFHQNAGGFAVSLSERLSLRSLTNRNRSVGEIMGIRFEGEVFADLPVKLDAANMITLTFPVHFQAAFLNGSFNTQLAIGSESEGIVLDAASFTENIVNPVFGQLQNYNPLKSIPGDDSDDERNPLRALLTTQVPVLDYELREILAGGVLGIPESPAFAVINFLIELDNIDLSTGGDPIDFGWVEVLPEFQYHEPTPDSVSDQLAGHPVMDLISTIQGLFGGGDVFASSLSGASSDPMNASFSNEDSIGADGTVEAQQVVAAQSLAGGAVSFPFLEEPASLLMLLIGGEQGGTVTFVEVDIPAITIGPSVNLEATLFNLDIGFLDGELKVALAGGLGLSFDIGFGYDSTGIRTGNPLHGFYLMDKDGPEIALGGSINASVDGRFSVLGGLFRVDFSGGGGARAQIGLDLFDNAIALPEPGRNDGRLHLHEITIISDSYHAPLGLPDGRLIPDGGFSWLCMFQLQVLLEANLSFSGKLKVFGKTVFNRSFDESWDIVDETLSCTIIEQAAHIDGQVLILNGGTYADRRFDGDGDVHEHFTVSESGGTVTVKVETFDLDTSDPLNVIETDFSTEEFDSIYGELGLGNDRVEIATNITIPATIHGGPGNDTLRGGGGNDRLFGSSGNNTLDGRHGNNELRGASGNDTLIAGTGNDKLRGGGGTNTFVIPEAWGTADIRDAGRNGTIDFDTTSDLTGGASFDEGEVTSTAGGEVTYRLDEIMTILGGDGNDQFTVNRYAPDGFTIDGRGGNDLIIVPLSGVDRTINVENSGGTAVLDISGTASPDTVFFRADGPTPEGPGETGFVALVTPTEDIDRVNYTDGITSLEVDGVGGANTFVLDDIAAPLTLEGGDGGSDFRVGQIFGDENQTGPVPGDALPGDHVRTRGVEQRGLLSLGVTHEAVIRGGQGDDEFTVFSNIAELNLQGIGGDNVFVLRAFILEGSVTAAGGDGNDRFEYVPNDLVNIDGGTGFNTMIVIGTELSDGFFVDANDVMICPLIYRFDDDGNPNPEFPGWVPEGVDRIPNHQSDGCGIDATFVNIQSIILHGLAGNNGFWVRGTSDEFHIRLFGGEDGATFLVGDETGDVTNVRGPVEVDGLADPQFDTTIPLAIVLPHEFALPSGPGVQPDEPYTDQDNRLVVNASGHLTDDVGALTESLISGLGMPDVVVVDTAEGPREFDGGITYETIDILRILLGSGSDDFVVESTHTYAYTPEGDEEIETPNLIEIVPLNVEIVRAETFIFSGDGNDDIVVNTIAGPTNIHLEEGDNIVRVGTGLVPGAAHPDRGSVLVDIADNLHVVGGPGDDRLILDASGTEVGEDGLGERVDVEQGLVTRLSMPGQVTHTPTLANLDIYLTSGEDVANVRGTSAGRTTIYGLEEEDRFFVSDASFFNVDDATPPFLGGHLTDIAGDLDVQGGHGDNLLMVSDRDSDQAITGATLDHDEMSGFADGTIFYDADGTFVRGITIWTGSAGDVIDVVGTRSDGDPTTLAWHGRDEGDPRTITTLNTMGGDDIVDVDLHDGDGLFVLNTGDGDDTVRGAGSSLGFIVFGGDGNDNITTGDGDDIVFGGHGRVEYCESATTDYHGGVAECGPVLTLLGDEDVANINDGIARAPARMYSLNISEPGDPSQVVEFDGVDGPVVQAFNNQVHVGGGDDIAWGGPGNDLITADDGRNALIGDHAEVWRFHPSELGGPTNVTSQTPFIDDDVLTGDIAYIVDIRHVDASGDDVITGGAGNDWIFGGPGEDIINGNAGNNIIWGGDGNDIIWGGTGDDRIYGGAGENVIDLKLPTFAGLTTPHDDNPDHWDLAWAIAPDVDTDGDATTTNGSDIIYGGHLRDILMADEGEAGPGPGDRLINWYGSFNLYLVCDGPYGAGRVLREPSPNMVEVLRQLADADGAYDVRTSGSSGFAQLALVIDELEGENRGAPHPDHPGNNANCGS